MQKVFFLIPLPSANQYLQIMEEYCFISVLIEGHKEPLQAVADKLNQTRNALKSEFFATANLSEFVTYCCFCFNIEVLEQDGDYALSLCINTGELTEMETWQCPNFPPEVYFQVDSGDERFSWTNDAERRNFMHPYFVIAINEDDEEIKRSFRTEEEANEFAAGYEEIFFYRYTTVSNVFPPIATKILRHIINAIDKQNELIMQ